MAPEPGTRRTRAIALLRRPVDLCWMSTANAPPLVTQSRPAARRRERPGLLRGVGMSRAPVDLEFVKLLAAELGLGQHAADRLFDEAFRGPGRQIPGRDRFQAARISGVSP